MDKKMSLVKLSPTRIIQTETAQVDSLEVPSRYDGPPSIEPKIYSWRIDIDILPIPFLSIFFTWILQALINDEDQLNAIMQGQGWVGSATLIDKKVDWRWAIPNVSVDRLTIKYTAAFATRKIGAFVIPAFLLTAGFAKWVMATIALVFISIALTQLSITLREVSGPKEYTPRVEGECSQGFIYDDERNVCVRFAEPVPWGILAIGVGLLGVGLILPQILNKRRD